MPAHLVTGIHALCETRRGDGEEHELAVAVWQKGFEKINELDGVSMLVDRRKGKGGWVVATNGLKWSRTQPEDKSLYTRGSNSQVPG